MSKKWLSTNLVLSVISLLCAIAVLVLYIVYPASQLYDGKEKLTVDHPKDTSTYDLYGPPVKDMYKHFEGDLPRLAF
jgi:hypothetical protein